MQDRDVSEVVAAGVDLLKRQEAVRIAFIASLEEADREGWLTIDDVYANMTALIDGMQRAKA